MSVHIYSAGLQPATNFVDRTTEHTFRFKYPPRKRLWADCCRRHRIAANCNVQVFYDMTRVFCKDGKGCKAAG